METYIERPTAVEEYINRRAQDLKIEIPPHEFIDGINILLKLKPPHWTLESFKKYVEFLCELFKKPWSGPGSIPDTESCFRKLFAK